jgi:hypothetical protein
MTKSTNEWELERGSRSHPPGGWELVRIISGRSYSEGRTSDRTQAIKHCCQRSSQYVQVEGELYGDTLPELDRAGAVI